MTDAYGTVYEPWQDGDLVGFKVTDRNGKVSYIYLYPSDEDSDGRSNVFLYQGETGDPSEDRSVYWIYSTGEAQ